MHHGDTEAQRTSKNFSNNAVAQKRHVEVDQQTTFQPRKFQVREQLSFMNWCKLFQ